MRIILSHGIALGQGLIIVAGSLVIIGCALIVYLWWALVVAKQRLALAPRFPQVPRDGEGKRIKQRL